MLLASELRKWVQSPVSRLATDCRLLIAEHEHEHEHEHEDGDGDGAGRSWEKITGGAPRFRPPGCWAIHYILGRSIGYWLFSEKGLQVAEQDRLQFLDPFLLLLRCAGNGGVE